MVKVSGCLGSSIAKEEAVGYLLRYVARHLAAGGSFSYGNFLLKLDS